MTEPAISPASAAAVADFVRSLPPPRDLAEQLGVPRLDATCSGPTLRAVWHTLVAWGRDAVIRLHTLPPGSGAVRATWADDAGPGAALRRHEDQRPPDRGRLSALHDHVRRRSAGRDNAVGHILGHTPNGCA
jgi:hypothetical protein